MLARGREGLRSPEECGARRSRSFLAGAIVWACRSTAPDRGHRVPGRARRPHLHRHPARRPPARSTATPPGSTPNIDRLGREGIVFEDVYSHCPLTLPAHASMLTGLLPSHHGVRDNIGFRLGPDHATLATRFQAAGLRTGAAVSAYVLRGRDRDRARASTSTTTPSRSKGGTESMGNLQRDGAVAVDALSRWIADQKGARFFAFLHLYEPHSPYTPPPRHQRARLALRRRGLLRGRARGTAHRVAGGERALRPRHRRRDLGPRRGPGRPRRGGARHLPVSRGRARAARPAPARRRARRARGWRARWPRPTSRRPSSIWPASRADGLDGVSLRGRARAARGRHRPSRLLRDVLPALPLRLERAVRGHGRPLPLRARARGPSCSTFRRDKARAAQPRRRARRAWPAP